MLLDHFPDRALSVIQSVLSDYPDGSHGAPDGERAYSAPAAQSVTYHSPHALHAARTPPLVDLPSVQLDSLYGDLPTRAMTTPAVLDAEVSMVVPTGASAASTRARRPAAAATLHVAAGGPEADVAMSSTSALSRVSSSGGMGPSQS